MNTCGECYYYTDSEMMRYIGVPTDTRDAYQGYGCKKFDRIISANTKACPEFRHFSNPPPEKPSKPEGTFRKWLKSIKIRRTK